VTLRRPAAPTPPILGRNVTLIHQLPCCVMASYIDKERRS
jgi:hypothetical protein